MLAACDSMGPRSATSLLRFAERKNESLERVLFRHTSMDMPRSSARSAGLALSIVLRLGPSSGLGRGRTRRVATRDRRHGDEAAPALPGRSRGASAHWVPLDHFCVEGWTAVATRTGVRAVRAREARRRAAGRAYVDFQSFDDDYHESWDIESAMHPQTLVVYAQDGHYLNAAWGAPARDLLAGEDRVQEHEIPHAHHVFARAQRRVLERSRLRVVRRRMTVTTRDSSLNELGAVHRAAPRKP